MSNQEQDNNQMMGEEPTRQMSPVEGEMPAFTARRRRSRATSAPESGAGQEAVPRAQGVPKPAALEYPGQARSQRPTEDARGVRHPVSAPGYEQRRPFTASETTAAPVRHFAPETDRQEERPRKKSSGGHKALLALVIVVLLMAAAVLGLLLVPEHSDSLLGHARDTVSGWISGVVSKAPQFTPAPEVRASDFTAAPTQGTAPLPVVFSLTTSKSVNDVRLVDAEGTVLPAISAAQQENSNQSIWVLNLMVQDAFVGDVRAEVFAGGEWQTTNQSVTLNIAASAAVPRPTELPAETEAPAAGEATDAPQAQDDLVVETIDLPEDTLSPENRSLDAPAAETDAPVEPKALSMEAVGAEATAPAVVDFEVVTNSAVDDIRLLDAGGEELSAEVDLVDEDPDAGRVWYITAEFPEPHYGVFALQIMSDMVWYDTGLTAEVAITEPLEDLELGEDPDAPEVSDAPEATAQPTAAPVFTSAPATQRPMATFTVTATPSMIGAVPQVTPEAREALPQVTELPSAENTAEASQPTEEPAVEELPEDVAEPEDGEDAGDGEEPVDPADLEDSDAVEDPADLEDPDAAEDPADLEDPDAVEEPAAPAVTAAPAPQAEPQPEPLTDQESETPTLRQLVAAAAESASPAKLIKSSVIYNANNKKISEYVRDASRKVEFSADGSYTYAGSQFGVLTFRGGNFRQNASIGEVGNISGMNIRWMTEAGSVKGSSKTYYGIGFTSQPAIIKWSSQVRSISNMTEEKKNTTALKEVIVAGEDGYIYFLDLLDGQQTRKPINVGYPMRGTPSVHNMGLPFMTVGQYARKMAKGTGKIGLRYYNLVNQKELGMIDGLDGKLNRPFNEVGSFETSSLFSNFFAKQDPTEPYANVMVNIGTNGMLYLTDLGVRVNMNESSMDATLSTVSMISKASGQKNTDTAVESSPAAYGSYVYYADMGGVLRCVDVNTMTTVWAVNTGDRVVASVALDLDSQGQLWLYTANTLQTRRTGDCMIRRYNAMTGEESWTVTVGVTKDKSKNNPVTAGAIASPVIGQNSLGSLVYFTVNNVTGADGKTTIPAALVAIDKATSRVAWTVALDSYTYSSPVAVYGTDGHGWIIQASNSGTLLLLDGLTGNVVNSLKLDGEINASPAVYKEILVIGTQGKDTSYIYGITLQ